MWLVVPGPAWPVVVLPGLARAWASSAPMSLKRVSLPFTTITSAVVDTSPTGLKLARL
ncbi:hypothetical protein D3C72_1941040 [compost metagenome]